ncbi:hypothetical protein RHIZ404_190044 [Rhizobium sp. EC-SD404]|nr:hypothetical protein RHIZ404_190044 [Rhizobium sp. EC-SD404]
MSVSGASPGRRETVAAKIIRLVKFCVILRGQHARIAAEREPGTKAGPSGRPVRQGPGLEATTEKTSTG